MTASNSASTLFSRPLFPRRHLIAAAGLLTLAGAAGLTPVARAQDTPTLVVLRADSPIKGRRDVASTALVQADIASIKVGGKPATITAWTPYLKGPNKVQLYVLLDSMISIGINEQFDDLKRFFNRLPPNVEIGVGYMLQGKAKTAQTFTSDRALAGAALHVPPDTSNPKNDNGSPYFVLKDLAQHWPNADPAALRACFMITDGIDRYNNLQGSDQLNPDIDSAAQTMSRAGIQGFSLYYMDPVPPPDRNEGGTLEGQTNLDQLATGTNGKAFYVGQFAPGSYGPLLDTFYTVLAGQSVATITANGKPGQYKNIDIKTDRKDIKVAAPDGVTLGNALPKK